MDSYDVLVIFLSVTLTAFLVLSIIAAVYLIKILQSIKKITHKAEHIADNVDSISSFFKKTTPPAAIAKLLSNIIDMFRNKGGDKNE